MMMMMMMMIFQDENMIVMAMNSVMILNDYKNHENIDNY